MDSISLGIHMGLKTKGAGENAFGEEHFRSHQTPRICKQQFEVCDDCVLGWVPFLIIECTGCLTAASLMCPGKNTPRLFSSCLCSMVLGSSWAPPKAPALGSTEQGLVFCCCGCGCEKWLYCRSTSGFTNHVMLSTSFLLLRISAGATALPGGQYSPCFYTGELKLKCKVFCSANECLG